MRASDSPMQFLSLLFLIITPLSKCAPTAEISNWISETIAPALSSTNSTSTLLKSESLESKSSTSTSITLSNTLYLVVPINEITTQQQASLVSLLNELTQEPLETVEKLESGVYFWIVNLTVVDAAKVKTSPTVLYFFEDKDIDIGYDFNSSKEGSEDLITTGQSLRLRDNTLLISERSIDPALKRVSQPPNADWSTIESYDYLHRAGAGITVYILDTGANIDHPQIKNIKGSLKWIYVTPYDTGSDEGDHGTCVLARVASPLYGTAKAVDVVVVKAFSNQRPQKRSMALKALADTAKDIKRYNKQGKAVVNLSFGLYTDDYEVIREIHSLVKDLILMDIPVVVASGNFRNAIPEPISALVQLVHPLRVGSELLEPLPLIVVGSVDEDGNRSWFSQARQEVDVSAVGELMCPNGANQLSERKWGTSYAVPQVSGQVAVILSSPEFYGLDLSNIKGQVASEVADVIRNSAYPRRVGGPDVLWNEINYEHMANQVLPEN